MQSHGIYKHMINVTLFEVSKTLNVHGPWLMKQLHRMGIFGNDYVPKPQYVSRGYFACVIEPNPCAPHYGMLSVFVTHSGVALIQYLVVIGMLMQYRYEYAVGPKIESRELSRRQ